MLVSEVVQTSNLAFEGTGRSTQPLELTWMGARLMSGAPLQLVDKTLDPFPTRREQKRGPPAQ